MTRQQIDCEQALRQIFAFIDRELSADDNAAMHDHLHACKACFSRAEFERLLKGKVGSLREEPPTDSVRDRVKDLLKGF